MFSDTPRLAPGPAIKPATRFLRETPIPKGRLKSRRRERRRGTVSFGCHHLGLSTLFEGVGNSAGIGGKLDAVQIARPRQLDDEFLLDPSRMRRKKQDSIAQTNRFADVVGDKDNG